MKGMSQTLYLVVAAMVILVTAVVVIAIFFRGVGPATGIAEAKALCMTQATTACLTFDQMPPIWNVQNIKVTGETSEQSCAQVVGVSCTCNENKLEGGCAPKPQGQ